MDLIALGILVVLLTAALVVLIRRRMKKQKRRGPLRFCENCGKKIRRKERTWYWHGAQVCLDCRKRLGELGEQ